MAKERSSIGGGGTRTTEHVSSTGWLGEDESYVRTNDYDSNGKSISSTKTDSNGNIWNVDSSGRTTEKLGNDGRND